MSLIRWLKISESLARKGHQVDIAWTVDADDSPEQLESNLRRLPLDQVVWSDYDVVKTLFHIGFETLEERGGADHPFIISKLGSVVGPEDRSGVFFYGNERAGLYATQVKIDSKSRYVTLLTEESKSLWSECFPDSENVLIVPGAADRELPTEEGDPFPALDGARCLYAGNIYDSWYQAEAHRVLVDKLNGLGQRLLDQGVRMYFLGHGDTKALDSSLVTSLGAVTYDKSWDYLRHAHAGIVLAFGENANVNESTKIYHYLRVGLPCVCEQGFPNEGLIEQAQLGYVAPNGNLDALADLVVRATQSQWRTERAVALIREEHSWDRRVEVYDRLIASAER